MGLFRQTLVLSWKLSASEDAKARPRLREVAQEIHESIRADVMRRHEAGEPVWFASAGVANPPGPTRLLLEDRRRSSWRRFRAVLSRRGRGLELHVQSCRFKPVPRDCLDQIHDAVANVPGVENLSTWSTL